MKKDRAKMSVNKISARMGVLILFITICALLLLAYTTPLILGYFLNQRIVIDGSINIYFLLTVAVSFLFIGAISFFTYIYVIKRFIFGWNKNTGTSNDEPPL